MNASKLELGSESGSEVAHTLATVLLTYSKGLGP